MQRLLGSLESIDDTAEITVIVLLLRKKSVNSRQRWKQVIFRCNISKLCFILPSLQYKLRRFFWCCRGRTPVDWTKQRKATSALSICVLQNYIHGFCWLLFSFYFLWCVYKSSRCDLWSANEFLNLWLETYRFKKRSFLVCLPCINQFFFFLSKEKGGEKCRYWKPGLIHLVLPPSCCCF